MAGPGTLLLSPEPGHAGEARIITICTWYVEPVEARRTEPTEWDPASPRVTRVDSLETSLDPAPRVEFALVADCVQAVGGKLYVLGGGWDMLWVGSFPVRHPSMGIGIRIRVPWSHLDEFVLSVDLVDEDGQSLFGGKRLSQRIRVKRRMGRPAGSDTGVTRAFTFNNLLFPKPGGYAFPIFVGSAEVARIRFRVEQRSRRPGHPTRGSAADG